MQQRVKAGLAGSWSSMALSFVVVMMTLGSAKAVPDTVITNQWHVRLSRDVSDHEARSIARGAGFTLLRRHLAQGNEFHFVHRAVEAGRIKRSIAFHRVLKSHPDVVWAEQLVGFKRNKRGFKNSAVKKGIPERPLLREKSHPIINDPLFDKEWYIKNTGQAGGFKNLDLNVMSAWQDNITGKGITTAIMDDGIDYMHPDIARNYNAEASYDFSSNDPFPYPRYTDDWFNSHGTRCAGEIASVRDNNICGVGVAYNSKIAGLRMLDQPYMTDLIEAAAMSHERDIIDIYSASWGPTDDGKTVDGPRNQTMRAIVEGVNKGRKGRGNIYVWASGDGGAKDDCNCDGYAASMWTISINSATNDGQTASYDESCASTLASTFSNGKTNTQDAGVATIDLYGNCTLHHSGTSAAAPEAAGVFALALEANGDLTWRDMQHLVVLTSKRNHLHDGNDHHKWTINGAGLEFNHLFGYGVLDAGDMVRMAKGWKTVPERFHCKAAVIRNVRHFNTTSAIKITVDTDACATDKRHKVNFIEHVQIFVTLKSSKRGAVTMFIRSPMGTSSMILSKRVYDKDNTQGFTKWPFMTTHTWGESPRGRWELTLALDTDNPKEHGLFTEAILLVHGTQKRPYDHISDKLGKKLALVKRQHKTMVAK